MARRSAKSFSPDDGQALSNRAFTPQRIYRQVRGIAPDLIVYLGDLAWRAIGTVGGNALFTLDNDTGPDAANHAQYGIMIFYDPLHPGHRQRIEGAQIYDVLPTLLRYCEVAAPEGLRGKVLGV